MAVMLDWLADTLRTAREEAGVRQHDVALAAGINDSNLSRFERGQAGWPRHTDEMVSAYAAALGVRPVDLWLKAATAWQAALANPHLDAAAAGRRAVRRSAR
jgi:transcriptional regulator with XRE-family HTH domain